MLACGYTFTGTLFRHLKVRRNKIYPRPFARLKLKITISIWLYSTTVKTRMPQSTKNVGWAYMPNYMN
jgi:hypothetical protein